MPRSRSTRIAAMLLAGTAALSIVGGCARPAARTPAARVPASQSPSSASLTATYPAGDLLVTLTVPRVVSSEVTAPASLTLTNRSDSVSVVQPFLWKIWRVSDRWLIAGTGGPPPAWRDRRKVTVDLSPGESLEVTHALRLYGPGAYGVAPSVGTSHERRGLVSTLVTVTVQ